MKHSIAAVVMAAGLSSRMAPENKLLAPMPDGCALIVHSVRHALASKASPVIVVTGFQAGLVEAALAELTVLLVNASDYAEGLAASLRAGMAMLPVETEAVLVMLGDMPLVAPATLDQLLDTYDPQSGNDIVVPVWRGERGNPRIWGKAYFSELKSLSGDAGANRLLRLYPDRVVEIESPDDSVLRDFDTREALDLLLPSRAGH